MEKNIVTSLTQFPSISVVIPVKDEASKIRACIEGILRQTVSVLEIIVVDSGSTDGTLDILREYDKVHIVEILSTEFNHGTSRNLGVNSSSGEYCLLTVGDASPCDDQWIEKLLKGFVNKDVAAVCGQQVVPHDINKNPIEWFRPVSRSNVITIGYTKDEFDGLLPEEKKQACSMDDVTALYKREILVSIPFRHTTYAEDAQWAKDALAAGYEISYNSEARVYHYHKSDPEFAFARSFTVFYHMYKFFGVTPIEKKVTLRRKLSIAKTLLASSNVSFSEKVFWWKYNHEIIFNNNRAARKFSELLLLGENALDEYHKENFSRPPVPLKTDR